MKKLIITLMTVIMLLGLVACGNNSDTTPPTDPSDTVEDTTSSNIDGAPRHILEQAAEFASNINSDEVPDLNYWLDAMSFLIYDVDREYWEEVIQCMKWGDDVMNIINPNDSWNDKYFTFEAGVFTLTHYNEWHQPIIGTNIMAESVGDAYIIKRHDANKPGYILMQAQGYGLYIVEITDIYHTRLTTLAQLGHKEFYIHGPWLEDMYNYNSSLSSWSSQANELFYQMDWEQDLSSQERWDEPMQFVTEHIPQSEWHDFFSHCPFFNDQVLPYSSYYGYTDINVINASDAHGYDTGADLWDFEDGKFILYSGAYHYVKWSKNISWDNDPEDYNSTRTGTLIDENEPGVIWVMFCDYYYHMVVIDPNNPTQLTNLSEFFPDEFSVLFWGPSNPSIIIVDENGDYIDLFTGEIVSGEE